MPPILTGDILDQFEPNSDETPTTPPKNSRGKLICARECADGSPCKQRVRIPFIACLYHENYDPVIE